MTTVTRLLLAFLQVARYPTGHVTNNADWDLLFVVVAALLLVAVAGGLAVLMNARDRRHHHR